MSYPPGRGVKHRIEALYRERPDEEMTIADLVTKFGASYGLSLIHI